MPGPRLAISWSFRILPLFLCASLCVTTAGASNPQLSRYPLRIHVLAVDESYKMPRMNPGDSVVCDAIDGMVTSISPSGGVFSGPVSISGLSGDPCSLHPEIVAGRLLDIDAEPVFSGAGRADLVTPPAGTQGFSFRYNDCTRVRVRPGFQSLLARWKKPGKKLEVLVPSDDIPVNGRPLPPVRCTLSVTLHDFVYLLLRNGTLIQVSQEDYWKRPALRVFLRGNIETVHQRLEQFTVPAHPAK